MSRKQGQTPSPKNGKTKPKGSSAENHKKDKSNQTTIGKAGRKKSEPLKLSETEELLKKHGLNLSSDDEEKRIYRKKEDLFDPEKDPKSEANRLKVRLSTRVSREHADVFNKIAEQKFSTKQEALQRAIELLLAEYDDLDS